MSYIVIIAYLVANLSMVRYWQAENPIAKKKAYAIGFGVGLCTGLGSLAIHVWVNPKLADTYAISLLFGTMGTSVLAGVIGYLLSAPKEERKEVQDVALLLLFRPILCGIAAGFAFFGASLLLDLLSPR